MSEKKDQSILVIGAGCFGLATAHHLATEGFSNITVLDKAEAVPSPFSAANDLNKVIRAEYADPFYTDLALVSGQVELEEVFVVRHDDLTVDIGSDSEMASRPIVYSLLP